MITHDRSSYAYIFNARIVEFRSLRRGNKPFLTPFEVKTSLSFERVRLLTEKEIEKRSEEILSEINATKARNNESPSNQTISLKIEAVSQNEPPRTSPLTSSQIPPRMEIVSGNIGSEPSTSVSNIHRQNDFHMPSTSTHYPAESRVISAPISSTSIFQGESISGFVPNSMIQNERAEPRNSGVYGNSIPNNAQDLAYINASSIPNPTLSAADFDEILDIFNEQLPDLSPYLWA